MFVPLPTALRCQAVPLLVESLQWEKAGPVQREAMRAEGLATGHRRFVQRAAPEAQSSAFTCYIRYADLKQVRAPSWALGALSGLSGSGEEMVCTMLGGPLRPRDSMCWQGMLVAGLCSCVTGCAGYGVP